MRGSVSLFDNPGGYVIVTSPVTGSGVDACGKPKGNVGL